MKTVGLHALNWLMHGLHLGVLGANMLGWLYRPWWPWHRLCVGLTVVSWLGLGLIVGRAGYCVLTDWHWQVRAALGERSLPKTYIEYLLGRMGVSVSRSRLTLAVVLGFVGICAIALVESWIERRG
jgi:hypothetical protein